MEITIVLDDDLLLETIKKQASIAVNQEVRKIIEKRINSMITSLESSVEAYLDKNLTSETIKKMVDNSTVELLKEKIEEINRGEY